ncbi:MAG: hypothetical protein ACYS9X_14415 [Planctomycetota bacterium]
MSRARTGIARAVACAAVACLLAAPAASPYPDEYGPFEGDSPTILRTYQCTLIESGTETEGAGGALTYARADGGPSSARVRLSRGEGTEADAVFMSVVDPAGRILAGPTRIADTAIVIPPAFWGDLNGDGREDFVALAVTSIGGTACSCDMGFALSSGKGYRITGVRSTRGPGANDFLDLGEGRVGFVHTALIERKRRDPGGAGAQPESFFVYSMLEVKGDRLVLADADPRLGGFPKWVPIAAKPERAEGPTLAEAEWERISAEVAARIIREPEAEGAHEVASAPE